MLALISTLVAGVVVAPIALSDDGTVREVAQVLVPTSEREPQTWRIAFEERAVNWFKEAVPDDDWIETKAPFGPRTDWRDGDLYARRWFDLGPDAENLALRIRHSGDAWVFLNQVPIAVLRERVETYRVVPLEEDLWRFFRPGPNLLAIHVRHQAGVPFLDAGVVTLRR